MRIEDAARRRGRHEAADDAAVVVLGTTLAQALPGAELVLPVTTVAEESGTFVNRDRRVQRYQQARTAPVMARPAWWVAAGAARADLGSAAEAFAAAAATVPALSGLTYADLGLNGRSLQAPSRRVDGVPA